MQSQALDCSRSSIFLHHARESPSKERSVFDPLRKLKMKFTIDTLAEVDADTLYRAIYDSFVP